MNNVTLIRLDAPDDSTQKYILTGPEAAIGRGTSLGCNDKRVSRNHGAICLLDDGSIVLESYNINPCFYKTQGQDAYAVLMKGQRKALMLGDEISLLPHSYRYRISAKNENTDTGQSNEPDIPKPIESKEVEAIALSTSVMKRKLPQWLSELPKNDITPPLSKAKKKKQDKLKNWQSKVNISVPSEENISSVPLRADPEVSEINANESTANIEVKQETTTCNEPESIDGGMIQVPEVKCEEDDEAKSTAVIKDESENEENIPNANDANDPIQSSPGPGSSNTNSSMPSRTSCMYGDQCFRKNAQHRMDFSHPGDADFDVNADNLPECQYGTSCYRKNLQHRKDFKHTKRLPRAATTQHTNAPSTSNVFCSTANITYNLCSRCQTVDSNVIDLTDDDDENDDNLKK